MNKEWNTAFNILLKVYKNKAFSNIESNHQLNNKDLNDALVRNIIKGVIRNTILLDYYIDKMSKNGIKSLNDKTIIILRMGMFALNELNSMPEYAIVNESVKLAKKHIKDKDKLINAILRNYIRERENINKISGFKDKLDYYSIKYSFPKYLLKIILKDYCDEEGIKIIKESNQKIPLSFSVNIIKTSRENLIKNLEYDGVKCYADENTETGIYCFENKNKFFNLYQNGYISMQSLSSIYAIEKFNPKSEEKILDMCAAPGGKSLLMAEIMGNKGEILAFDIFDHRINLIKNNIERTGIDIIKTKKRDSQIYDRELKENFDKVLIDVPCTGTGVIRSKPEIKFKNLSKESIYELNVIQEKLLKNGFSYLKNGGKLMYSTCSILKSENEEMVRKFISRNENAKIIESTQILPYNNRVGFYFAVIKKLY